MKAKDIKNKKTAPKIPSVAVLLLGGSGERYKSDLPKQFVKMGGKPLFLYAYDTFVESSDISKIVLVVKKGYEKTAKDMVKGNDKKLLGIIEGGKSREESSYKAIKALETMGVDPYTLVFIHDADRPLLSLDLIKRLKDEAKKSLFAVPALPIEDSMAYSKDGKRIAHYGDRRGNYTIQTPQVAAYSIFLKAFEKEADALELFTDDGSLAIAGSGLSPVLVKGDRENIKINDKEGEALFLKLLGKGKK